MAEETTYLELSEADGGSHKFYEVITNETQVRIRYGRIGEQGQTQTSNHATTEHAQKFARKKGDTVAARHKMHHNFAGQRLHSRCSD